MITHKSYSQLTSAENLFQAWSEFRVGKRKRKDVQGFERNLEDNLFALHESLIKKTYRHGSYFAFFVHDPKRLIFVDWIGELIFWVILLCHVMYYQELKLKKGYLKN